MGMYVYVACGIHVLICVFMCGICSKCGFVCVHMCVLVHMCLFCIRVRAGDTV